MKHVLLLAASALAGLAMQPSAANAATIISCGGGSCFSNVDNVLLEAASNVSTGFGQTNTNPATRVQFTSATDMLNLGSGQSFISAVDQVLNSLTFTLLDGFGFERAEFNLPNGLQRQMSVTITTLSGATNTFNLSNSNGANRFGITADAGELLTGATFTSAIGFDSFRQLRIGGVGPLPTGAIPEPGTWAMMLLGFGVIGSILRGRRKVHPKLKLAYK